MREPFRHEQQGDVAKRKAGIPLDTQTASGGNRGVLPPRAGDTDLMELPERPRKFG